MRLTELSQAGARDARAFIGQSVALGELPLARFAQEGTAGLLARRVLLAADIPSRWLELAGSGRRQQWLETYAYWRGVRQAVADPTWRQIANGPIVLLYHALGRDDEPASRYVLPVRKFAQHMAWLRTRGYVVLGLDELLQCLRTNRLPPARSVVITFDDAYADTYALAFPILQRLSLPATVFAVSQCVGGSNDWEPTGPLAGRPLMSWSDLREMLAAGIRIGAHSRSHRSLPTMSEPELEDEIGGSRSDLERELASPIDTFAYPFGHTNNSVEAAVRQAGFLGACGVQPGICDPCVSTVALPRIEMQGTWRLTHFALALHLGHVPGRLAR